MNDPRKLKAMTSAIERLERAFAVAMNASQNLLGEGKVPAAADVPPGGFRSFRRVRAVRDKAELARRRGQHDGLGVPVENRAAELKVRAERRLGQLLECLAPRGGDHRSSRRKRARSVLAELGVTHNQSSRWRREAELSDREFEKYLADAKRRGERVSAADVLRLAEMLPAGNGRLVPDRTRS